MILVFTLLLFSCNDHLPLILPIIYVKWTRYYEHCYWKKNELTTFTNGPPTSRHAIDGRPAKSCIHYLWGNIMYLHMIFKEQCPIDTDNVIQGLFDSQRHVIVNHHHRHHHPVPLAKISPNLSRHPSLSSIALGRSSMLHPISVQSCYW